MWRVGKNATGGVRAAEEYNTVTQAFGERGTPSVYAQRSVDAPQVCNRLQVGRLLGSLLANLIVGAIKQGPRAKTDTEEALAAMQGRRWAKYRVLPAQPDPARVYYNAFFRSITVVM